MLDGSQDISRRYLKEPRLPARQSWGPSGSSNLAVLRLVHGVTWRTGPSPAFPVQVAWGGATSPILRVPGPHLENHRPDTTPSFTDEREKKCPRAEVNRVHSLRVEPGLSPQGRPWSLLLSLHRPGPGPPALLSLSCYPSGSCRLQEEGAGLWVPLLRGGRLGGVKHLLPAFHPRHGLHVLPPVAHLHGPLLWAGPTHRDLARQVPPGPSKHKRNRVIGNPAPSARPVGPRDAVGQVQAGQAEAPGEDGSCVGWELWDVVARVTGSAPTPMDHGPTWPPGPTLPSWCGAQQLKATSSKKPSSF